MVYRTLGRTGIAVSQIGLGCEHLQGKPYEIIKSVIDAAIDNGINILDVFMSEPQVRTDIGKALIGRREKVILQGHIGSVWKNGQYYRSRDINECKSYFEDLLERLQTDYMDIGMIHFVDSEEDYSGVFDSDIIQYAVALKEKGIIKTIGLSSHNPVRAKRAVETGLIDVLMFSINPAYDLLPEETAIEDMYTKDMLEGDSFNGINPERAELYRLCEKTGTGITVMKCFLGGMLLNEAASPFGIALKPEQCIGYALTRPAVASVLVGCVSPEQVVQAVGYEKASRKDKDFSQILSGKPKYSARGVCVYCNHCLPCPSKIDIAQVNKYIDLSSSNDSAQATVKEHYRAMETHAEDCIACGSCEKNCPFGVQIIERMKKAKTIFGM